MSSQHVKITYTNCFVAFLDILGFKELVLSKNKEKKRKLEKYFSTIKEITEDLELKKYEQNLKSITISDSIILSVPFGKNVNQSLSQLRHLCVTVGKIQYRLALDDIWLRGAISCGDAFFENNQVVGPAYTKAFLLEETSKYPRVILDPEIIEKLEIETAKNLIDYVNESYNGGLKFSSWLPDKILFEWNDDAIVNKRIKRDTAFFIDYLLPCSYDVNHLDKIIFNIRNSIYQKAEVYSKFRWVADYLTACLEQTNSPLNVNISLQYDWLKDL